MTHRLLGLFFVGFAWLACSSEVIQERDPSTSSAATNGSSTTGAGASSSSSVGAGGSFNRCDGLAEAACMAMYPSCAPAYDDACCPACNPGTCADCSDFEFQHCGPLEDVCNPNQQPAPCWLAPDWACQGGTPACPPISMGEYACDQAPGCVVAVCSPDANCPAMDCHPVTGRSCTTQCDSVPPSCPSDQVAESDGFCYTGFCIPLQVCGGI